MNSIAQDTRKSELISTKTKIFFRRFRIAGILKSANAYKCKGIPVVQIFMMAFAVVFQSRSLYMQMHLNRDALPFAKDTFYRFMNSCHTNWRKFTMLLCSAIIRIAIEPLTSESRRNVLIVDDSLFHRARSKKVELLARVYDHAKGEYTFGFRMLTLGWSDGNTFLPVSHALVSTGNRKSRMNEASGRIDARTNGAKQRSLAQKKATESMIFMLREAKQADIRAGHVLFDTWFCSPSMLIAVRKIGFHAVAMAKKSEKVFYRVHGKMQDVKAIYKAHRKRRGRSKYLLSVEAEACKDGQAIPVRLVFVRNKSNRKDWLVLATTDMGLGEEEIIALYGKRWGIEVFFKACKSYLRLERECRAISYDAMTAHVAIVFTRYMFLAVEQRENCDERSLGELFYMSIDELPDIQFTEAMRLIMTRFAEMFRDQYILNNEEVGRLLDLFMEALPNLLSDLLKRRAGSGYMDAA